MPHEPDPTDPGPLYSLVEDPLGRTYLRLLGRPDGGDMVYRISGSVCADVPGDALAPRLRHGTRLFGFEGFNIRRLHREPGTNRLHLLTRELVFYTDPAEPARILREWRNPVDGRTYPVVPVNNDPVNQGPFPITRDFTGPPPLEVHGRLVWSLDIPPRTDLGAQLGEGFGLPGGVYTTWELFDFAVDAAAVDRGGVAEGPVAGGRGVPRGALPVVCNWSRVGPWPPFTGLAESATGGAGVVYHARSWTLEGFGDLEPWLREAVEAEFPAYAAAPEEPGPSRTSWSSFWRHQLGEGSLSWAQWCEENGT
ncbi:DUF1838 domain-containing protein [Glycomyces sp. A-F 0318]|uniref:DUF1838 family protein n=1 Tax=Glycomyces amatae TaxID=2881355 RepID=UPI001E420319|nr:DUF1838 family protein [Glycomyces amatae]MCD0445073.1 DUF1838 domain-containing protein [Glycomyces amatae]